MSNEYHDLKKACQNFSEKNDLLRVGAVSYESQIPLEEQILGIKESIKNLSSKLKIVDVDVKRKSLINVNEPDIKIQSHILFNKLIDNDLETKALETANFSAVIEDALTREPINSSRELYKNKIIEQLKQQKLTSNKLRQNHSKHKAVLEESMKIRADLLLMQNTYREKLQEQKLEYERENAKKPCKKEMKRKLDKLNFMRMTITNLLTHSKLEWSEKFMNLFEKCRTPITFESITEEASNRNEE